MIKAIIFDVDGTLAETEDGHRMAFNKAFEQEELPWHWDQSLYRDLLAVTGGKERIRHFVETYKPKGGDAVDDEWIKALHAIKTGHYTALVAEGRLSLRPGVRSIMEQARAKGLRLAISTTTTPANVTALIGSTIGESGLSWFDVIGAGDVVPAKKPAPDIYQYVLAQLNLGPEEALAIEDSEAGLKSARAAGIPSVVTESIYTNGGDFDGAAAVLPHLPDNLDDLLSLAGVKSPAGVGGA
ncbi:MAG: HAD-IA family hydrolase [Magnetovibrionaceae bacterium]